MMNHKQAACLIEGYASNIHPENEYRKALDLAVKVLDDGCYEMEIPRERQFYKEDLTDEEILFLETEIDDTYRMHHLNTNVKSIDFYQNGVIINIWCFGDNFTDAVDLSIIKTRREKMKNK